MRSIGIALDITPIDIVDDSNIEDELFISKKEPFQDNVFMHEFRVENGKNSWLVNKYNGSDQQKNHLTALYKNRDITWGNKISDAKSKTSMKLRFNGQVVSIKNICEFALDNNLNPGTLRLALKRGSGKCKTKGNLIEFL